MAKALGTDDSVNSCMCCGRKYLKFTVIIELDNGDIVNYGQLCAAKNTGKTHKIIKSEIKAHTEIKLKAAKSAYYDSEIHAAWIKRNAELSGLSWSDSRRVGKEAWEFVREVSEKDDALRVQLAKQFGVYSHQI